jgi:peptide/nickel transport system substrate-binding protein
MLKNTPVSSLFLLIEQKPLSDRLLLRILFFTMVFSGIIALSLMSQSYAFLSPVKGGAMTEGIIGTPRFVNPVLATTRVDLDLSTLVFSGLMKINPNGELVPHLAESVTVSDDGTVYNVVVRPNLRFHDGTPLTARDVAFTIGMIQDADLKSPLRGNWVDIQVEEISEYELNFVLEEAYSPFIENLTVGIIPRHIWSDLPIEQVPFSDRNTNPIGSGPYTIKTITRNSGGIIQSYLLQRFSEYFNQPNITTIETKFYQNETDLVAGYEQKQFTHSAYFPTSYLTNLTNDKSVQVSTIPIPRVFAVFLNQNRTPALRDIGARQALHQAIDREALVNTILFGYGVPTTTPLPESLRAVELQSTSTTVERLSTPTEQAIATLTNAGWRKNDNGIWEKRVAGDVITLQFTLRTANNPLFEQTANRLAEAWRAVGIPVQVEQYEQSALLQNVIRPRDYETLLFGLEMGRAVDLYPFWHSSQREDPGLNIAQYANIEVDRLLTEARKNNDLEQRKTLSNQVNAIIANEYPAVFLFTPSISYVTPALSVIPDLDMISRPHERFMNIETWYNHNEKVWPIFQE